MTSERKDPRETVTGEVAGFDADHSSSVGWLHIATSKEHSPFSVGTPVRVSRLNAADPLRAMLPEVVEALEKIQALTGHMDSTAEEVTEAWKLSREALARLREIHPTTGGADDA